MHEPFDKCGKARHIEAAKPRDEVATPYPQPLIGTGCTRRVHAPFGRCGKAHHTEVVEPGDEVANPYPFPQLSPPPQPDSLEFFPNVAPTPAQCFAFLGGQFLEFGLRTMKISTVSTRAFTRCRSF